MNDSKKPCGSRVDRHEHIGKGCLGLEPFRRLVNGPALRAPADAARDAQARYAREPAQGRRRSVGHAQPADAAQADARGRMTQMAKRWLVSGVLTLAVAGAAPAPAAAWGFEPHKYIMGRAIQLLPAGDPSVLRQVPDVDRRARHRSGSVAHRRVGTGAAAALPRHGRVRALSVSQLPARARRSGQALRRRLRRQERAAAVARHGDLPEARRGVPPAGPVLARQHQVLLVGAHALRLGRPRPVPRGGQLRRAADRSVRGFIRGSRRSCSSATAPRCASSRNPSCRSPTRANSSSRR